MVTANFTVQAARLADGRIELKAPEIKGAPLTLVIVWADGRTEIRPTDVKCCPGWDGAEVRAIDVVFQATNVCVHHRSPAPGPQTEAEYGALVEEVQAAIARGEYRQLVGE